MLYALPWRWSPFLPGSAPGERYVASICFVRRVWNNGDRPRIWSRRIRLEAIWSNRDHSGDQSCSPDHRLPDLRSQGSGPLDGRPEKSLMLAGYFVRYRSAAQKTPIRRHQPERGGPFNVKSSVLAPTRCPQSDYSLPRPRRCSLPVGRSDRASFSRPPSPLRIAGWPLPCSAERVFHEPRGSRRCTCPARHFLSCTCRRSLRHQIPAPFHRPTGKRSSLFLPARHCR